MTSYEAADGLHYCTMCRVVSREISQRCMHHYVIRQREYRPDAAFPDRKGAARYGREYYSALSRVYYATTENEPKAVVPVRIGVRAHERQRLFLSCFDMVVRDPDACAMLREIIADHRQVLASSSDSRIVRAVVYGSTVLAICWHLGVFAALSSAMKLVERVFARRA